MIINLLTIFTEDFRKGFQILAFERDIWEQSHSLFGICVDPNYKEGKRKYVVIEMDFLFICFTHIHERKIKKPTF